MPEAVTPLARLAALGLVTEGAEPRPTRRWHAAMARAALRLQRAGAPYWDLRMPIAAALVELCPDLTDAEIARCVEAMLPIEERSVAPAGLAR